MYSYPTNMRTSGNEHNMMPDYPRPTYSPEEEECLKDRKWWAFLLSSIFTFLAGIRLSVFYFKFKHQKY